jgi:hypothetical protein
MYRGEGDIQWEFETLHITIPIQPNPRADNVIALQPSTFSVGWSPKEIALSRDAINFSFVIKGYCIDISDDQIAQHVQHQRDSIRGWLATLAKDIDAGNKALKEAIIKKLKPRASSPVEYVLEREKVLGVIEILDNQGRQFEKTPKTYQGFGEEQLRDVLLVNLNSVFQGNATGETFSHRGKTDIYLAIDKGNILVCECKIWGGQALLLTTIEQLLGYLTWRHNFGIVIVFVRQQSITGILKTAADSIKTAASYKSGFRQVSESHFSALHRSPSDADKETEIHYLFYNLYFPVE